MSELPIALLALLFDWSIRFGILILGLMAWFRLRPPASVYTRLFLGHLVLLAGLALPLTPRWWSIPWPTGEQWMGKPVSSEPIQQEDFSPTEIVSRNHTSTPATFPLTPEENPRAEKTPSQSLPDQNTRPLEPILSKEPSQKINKTSPLSWTAILAGIWALGASFFLVRILAGIWWLGQIKRTAQFPSNQLLEEWEQTRLELGVQRKVRLRESPCVATPALFGGWNPVVAIPLDWECEPVENRRAGFLHEWAHIQHRDDWAKTRDELVRSVFFFHPLVHWLLNQLGLDRELRCDALATRHGVPPRDLAEVLLAQVKKLGIGNSALIASPALSFFQPHSAKERIQKLLEADMKRWSERVSRFQGTMVAFIVMGLAFGLGGLGQASPETLVTALAPIPGNLGTVEVTGTVLLENGKPAEGALVWAADAKTVIPIRPRATANRQGEFRLALPKGEWKIWASKGTQGGEADLGSGANDSLLVSPPNKIPPLSISLEERGMVQGRFVDADTGKPVPNARIHLNNGFTTTTDQEGKWEAGGLERRGQSLVVVAPGVRPSWFQFDTTEKPITSLELELKSGNPILGAVKDEKGNPIPGSWVGTRVSDGMYSAQGGYIPCAENGDFAYAGGKNKVELTAWAPGYITQERTVSPFETGKERRVTFQLKKAPDEHSLETDADSGVPLKRIVSGKVTLPDGGPAAGVYLRWGIENYSTTVSGVTDQNGLFKITVPQEENSLLLIPKGYHPEVKNVPKTGDQSIDIALKAGQKISGVVTDATGKPLKNASLIPIWTTALWQNSAKTDQNGKYELRGMPENIRFYIYKTGYWELRDFPMVGNEPDTISLQSMGVVKGKVLDFEGKPVKNFRVTINRPKNPDPKDQPGQGIAASYTGLGLWFSSDDGSFMVSGLNPGSAWRVQAYAKGMGSAVVDRMVAVPAETVEKTPPTIITGEKPVSLKLRIRDGEGKAIPQAKVILVNGKPDLDTWFSWSSYNGNWENKEMETSDQTGLVHFPKLSFKEATVLIEAPGFARQKFGWRKGETHFSISMKKEAIFIGKVQFPIDWKDHDWYYQLTSQNGDVIRSEIDPKNQGKFIVRELPEGSWNLEVGPLPSLAQRGALPPAPVTETIELKAGQLKEWKGEWKP